MLLVEIIDVSFVFSRRHRFLVTACEASGLIIVFDLKFEASRLLGCVR